MYISKVQDNLREPWGIDLKFLCSTVLYLQKKCPLVVRNKTNTQLGVTLPKDSNKWVTFVLRMSIFRCMKMTICINSYWAVEPSWSWLYGSWIYNYLCNQCVSPQTLWVQILLRRGVLDTTLCDIICQWLMTGRWFSPGAPISSTNKTDCHYLTEILLKVALNTINHQTNHLPVHENDNLHQLLMNISIFFIGTESSVRLVDVDGDGLLDIITGLAMGREITTMIDEFSMDKFCHKLGNYLWKESSHRSSIPPISTKRTITPNLNSLSTKEKPQHMTMEIQILAWDRHKMVTELNRLMESQLFIHKSTFYTIIKFCCHIMI